VTTRSPSGATLGKPFSRRLQNGDLFVRAVGAQLHDQPRHLPLLLDEVL